MALTSSTGHNDDFFCSYDHSLDCESFPSLRSAVIFESPYFSVIVGWVSASLLGVWTQTYIWTLKSPEDIKTWDTHFAVCLNTSLEQDKTDIW